MSVPTPYDLVELRIIILSIDEIRCHNSKGRITILVPLFLFDFCLQFLREIMIPRMC